MSASDETVAATPSRQERRKERTRDSIVEAARELLIAEGPDVSIQAITDRADVAIGSFYNHFEGKQDVFVAVAMVLLQEFEADLAQRVASITDPAEIPCVGLRLILRLPDTHPDTAKVFVAVGPRLPISPTGYSPAFEHDIRAAIAAGRYTCQNPELLMIMISGAYQHVLTLRMMNPSIGPEIVDDLAQEMLEMFGMTPAQAKKIAHKKLPPEVGAPPARHAR